MTNRALAYIVRNQDPVVLSESATVAEACRAMIERKVGTVLAVDAAGRLSGILAGRDVVRLLARAGDAGAVRIAEAMTPRPVTVESSTRAIDALRRMEAGGFRHLPVVDRGHVRGVVARGDFKGMELEHVKWRECGERSEEHRTLANVLGFQNTVAHGADETLRDACKSMAGRKSGSVAVLDKGQKLVGIFTGRDAVRAVSQAKNAGDKTLAKWMTRKPVTIGPDALALDALRAMWDGGFRHLPVVEKGKLLGVISRSDFTGCELDKIEEERHLYECLW